MPSPYLPDLAVDVDRSARGRMDHNQNITAHSRDSSAASDDYSPTSTNFSQRDNSRFASSCSSLVSARSSFEPPESPNAVAKTVLHDLVEDPDEMDDQDGSYTDLYRSSSFSYEDMTIEQSMSSYACQSRPSLDYDLADGFRSDTDFPVYRASRRHPSSDMSSSMANLTTRIGQRLPSISRRFKDLTPAKPLARQGTRSAPLSRTSSFRMPSLTKSLVTHLESRDLTAPNPTPQVPERTVEIDIPNTDCLDLATLRPEDPIDRRALASTPLLPPMMLDRRDSDPQSLQSPLQSPTIADNSSTFSLVTPPNMTPAMPALSTPKLGSKASVGSIRGSRTTPLMQSPEFPLPGMEDKWTAKLGHANFSIFPRPYMPEICDVSSCKRLVEDWESARRQYLNHAAHTSENYGPTSQTLKFTEQKWAEIDTEWKRNHEATVARAKANGEAAVFQPLAESAPLAKMPSLDGPESHGKFPTLDDSEIVGPMVQYAKINRQPVSKRPAFLRFFSDLRLSTTGRNRSPTA